MPQPLPDQPSSPAVLKVAGIILAVLAGVIGVAIWLVHAWNAEPNPHWPTDGAHRIPAHLEAAPQPALGAYLKEKNQLLNGYAWIDQKSSLARIPIDLAMRAVAAGVSPSGGPAARQQEAERPAAAPYLRAKGARSQAPASAKASDAAPARKETSP